MSPGLQAALMDELDAGRVPDVGRNSDGPRPMPLPTEMGFYAYSRYFDLAPSDRGTPSELERATAFEQDALCGADASFVCELWRVIDRVVLDVRKAEQQKLQDKLKKRR